MKQGMILADMVAELDRQQEVKRDFVTDTRNMTLQTTVVNPAATGSDAVKYTAPTLALKVGDEIETLKITDHCHGQFAEKLKIPVKHYRRLLADHPDLLSYELNTLLSREPKKNMLRTLDGSARAFMSDRYRPLDNYDLIRSVYPVLKEVQDLQILSCNVTETKMYLKAVFPRVEGELEVGDIVQSGIVITNSEVGASALSIRPLLYRLWCKNGCSTDIGGQRRTHLGKRAADSDHAYEIYTDETLSQDDKAFWMKVNDTVRALTDRDGFLNLLGRMNETKLNLIEGDAEAAIEITRKKFGYSEELGKSLLQQLLIDSNKNGLSQFGVSSAITRVSQDVDDYDLASKMERDGGKVIELPTNQWREIALAA